MGFWRFISAGLIEDRNAAQYPSRSGGSYYILPEVVLARQTSDENAALFCYDLHTKSIWCRKHQIPIVNVGVYDDEQEVNQEHATTYHWIKACPVCLIAEWITPEIPEPVYRRNFTWAELQRLGVEPLEGRPRELAPNIVW